MFIYDPRPTFTHTVKVRVPVDGGFEDQDFKATFEVVPTDEIRNYNLDDRDESTAFLTRIVKGMDDLVGKDDQPVPYNDQVRDVLLRLLYVRKALVKTYLNALSGAQAGN